MIEDLILVHLVQRNFFIITFQTFLTMKNPLLFFLAFALVGMVACNQAPVEPAVDMDALTLEIQAMEDAYMTAEIAKDADAIVAYYADDVTSYGSNRAPSVGKDAIRTSLAERMAKDTSGNSPTFKVMELYVGDDHITEIGSWTETAPDGSVADNGTYISIFKKNAEGKWACIRDMAVSHTPKETAPTAEAAPAAE